MLFHGYDGRIGLPGQIIDRPPGRQKSIFHSADFSFGVSQTPRRHQGLR
jgi:hypothetical protein